MFLFFQLWFLMPTPLTCHNPKICSCSDECVIITKKRGKQSLIVLFYIIFKVWTFKYWFKSQYWFDQKWAFVVFYSCADEQSDRSPDAEVFIAMHPFCRCCHCCISHSMWRGQAWHGERCAHTVPRNTHTLVRTGIAWRHTLRRHGSPCTAL